VQVRAAATSSHTCLVPVAAATSAAAPQPFPEVTVAPMKPHRSRVETAVLQSGDGAMLTAVGAASNAWRPGLICGTTGCKPRGFEQSLGHQTADPF
jgi:hypothetical protein